MSKKALTDPRKLIQRLDRERKQREEQEKRTARAVKLSVTNAVDKENIVRLFKKLGPTTKTTTLKESISEFRLLAAQNPSLGYVLSIVNDKAQGNITIFVNIMKILIAFFERSENRAKTLEECIDELKATDFLQRKVSMKAEPEAEPEPEPMEAGPIPKYKTKSRFEQLESLAKPEQDDSVPKGKKLTQCVKTYRAAPWVSASGKERVIKTEIKPYDGDEDDEHPFVIARPNFFGILCTHSHHVTVNNVLVIDRCEIPTCMCHELWTEYLVRYTLQNIDTKKNSIMMLDQNIMKRREKYLSHAFDNIEKRVVEYALTPADDKAKEIALSFFPQKPFGKRVVRILFSEKDTVLEFFKQIATFIAYMVTSEDKTMETYFMHLTRRGYKAEEYIPKLYYMTPSEKLGGGAIAPKVLEYYAKMERYYTLLMCFDYYIVENRSDRFEHIPIPVMPASGILLRPKEAAHPPEPEEIILKDKPYVPKGIISIFNIFSYIGAAINDVFKVAGQKQNICEICDKKLHHTYKTININEDNLPEIVKFCSIKCMDSHEEYEFE